MRKHQKLIAYLTVVMTICIFSIPAFAASDVLIYLGANQGWSDRNVTSDTRSGDYESVYAKCHSVYPESGIDTFTKIQARVTNMYGLCIGINDYVVLTEGASQYTHLYIDDAYLNLKTAYFQFRGNTNKAAYSTVSYDGR